MPVINSIVQQMITWLGSQHFLPTVREITSVGLLPGTMFPHIAVVVENEAFSPHDTDATAEIGVRISYAAGRPADALCSVRDMAHQVRTALNKSHGLGGIVKRLRAGNIRYSELASDGEQAVIATAIIELVAKYSVSTLTTDH